ncbi:MAG: oligosaccharide flippase family protein [Burkholderiales bacterium]|nr:oligosaccharide flippase family protein [Burkholderiales bacterium]
MRTEATQVPVKGRQSLSHRTARGAVWSLASQASLALGALITFVAVSRAVDHGELGEYMLAIAVVAAVQWLALNAYREPVIQTPELTPAMLSSTFWFSAVVAVLLALALIAAAYCLRWLDRLPVTAACLPLLSGKVLFDTLSSVPLALCHRDLRFSAIAKLNMLVSACGLAVSLALLHAGWGVLAVAAALCVMSALSFAMVLACSGWLPSRHFSAADLGFLRRYSPHVVLWQGVEALNMHLDRFIIGARLSTQALGVYGFGRRLNDVVVEVLAGALGNVALPAYASIQNDRAALKRGYLSSVRMAAFGVFPLIGILFGIADELVVTVFGNRWAPAVPVYQCFLFLGAIQTIGIFQASLIRSLGHANLWARYQVMQAAANIIVIGFAVEYGIHALALAVVIRTGVVWTYALAATCRLLGMRIRDYLGMFAGPAAGAVFAGAVAQGIVRLAQDAPPVAVLAAASAIAGAAYLGIALILMRPVAHDVLALFARRV